jgi:hypothetical protein
VHLAVQRLLAAALFAARRLTIFFTSWLRLRRPPARRRGLDHHHVVQAHHADQAAGGAPGCCGCPDDGVAHGGVAVGILVGHLPDGIPGAQVVPAGGQRHHADVEARLPGQRSITA